MRIIPPTLTAWWRWLRSLRGMRPRLLMYEHGWTNTRRRSTRRTSIASHATLHHHAALEPSWKD
jgi:hypothetical protein